jgi:hypothetical protein
MKLTIIILITLGIQVSSASFGQRVTISRQNTGLKTILQDLRKQTGYYFIFNNEVIRSSRSLSLDLKNVTLDEALN